MKKFQQIYQAIADMNIDKNAIESWVEDITPKFANDIASDGFEVDYKATYVLSSVSADNNIIEQIIVILASRDVEQPDMSVHTSVINKSKIDLVIEINFTEQAKFIDNPNGKWRVLDVPKDLIYTGFSPDTAEKILFTEAVPNAIIE